jgi:ankyrin repeat protein
MLAANGADLEIRGYMEKTPFLKACSRGCLPMVELLVRLGANIRAVVDDGGPPLGGVEFTEIFDAPKDMKEYVRALYRA